MEPLTAIGESEGFRWLRLLRCTYVNPGDAEKKPRQWEYCERTTRRGKVDAVCMEAIIRYSNRPSEILFVAQYRPPLAQITIEMPAGLIDENETPEEAALRELYEETGYSGKVFYVSEAVPCDPGVTNATFVWVGIDIDGEAACNVDAHPHLDEGEDITVLKVPFTSNLLASVPAMLADVPLVSNGHVPWMLDSRVLGYMLGLERSQGLAERPKPDTMPPATFQCLHPSSHDLDGPPVADHEDKFVDCSTDEPRRKRKAFVLLDLDVLVVAVSCILVGALTHRWLFAQAK